MDKKDKIFLGGTCAETKWRDELIPLLDRFSINYFNPVVEDWTPECQAIEEDEKNRKCNIHLYVITPEMKGTYSIAEIIHSAHLANMYGTSVDRMIFAILESDKWQKHELKSLDAVTRLAKDIGRDRVSCGYVQNMKDLLHIIIDK